MIRLVIFGTGSSGECAWQAAGTIEGVQVVAFADNDARKQGTLVHGLPVIAPAKLGEHAWDRVVLASQWAGEIEQQLVGLGIEPARILKPGISSLEADIRRIFRVLRIGDGRWVRPDHLPRVLILSRETLSDSHGTGVMIQRYFRDFPRKHLFSLCHHDTGRSGIEQTVVLPGPEDRTPARVASELGERGFTPDLVYTTTYTENGLALTAAALAALPPGLPVVQHFMDFMPRSPQAFDQAFRALLPRVTAVWALTESLRDLLMERYGQTVRHVSCLHQSLPADWHREHRNFEPGFRTVLLGNPWQMKTMPLLAEVWRRCREMLPGLLPIEWFCHPMRAQALVDAGIDLGFDIVWRGFVPRLQERLRAADLAIVPFNHEAAASSNYTRHSIPSRITELAGAGLPVFALASADTEPARLINLRGIGRVAAGPDPVPVVRALVAFIRDREARAVAGGAARALAETEFCLEPFQEWLLGTFFDLARSR